MQPTIIPYNEKSFTPEEVDAGMVTEFIDFLLKQDKKTAELRDKNHKYTNINIVNDGYCTIVQYCEVFFEDKSSCFEFVNYDEHVAKVLDLPDNSTVLCWDEDDAKEMLDEWLKDNPGWKKNEWGHWYNEAENEAFRKLIEEQSSTNKSKPDIK